MLTTSSQVTPHIPRDGSPVAYQPKNGAQGVALRVLHDRAQEPGPSVLERLDDRILTYYHEALELRRGLLCRPRFALIYPTYRCNHNCSGCDYSEQNGQAIPRSLSQAQFDHLIDELVGFDIRAVEFCGGGEPLLNPHIDGAIKKLRANGVQIGLLTNGTAISEARAELLTAACSYIRVSVEAGTEVTFQRVKRPASRWAGFPRVLHNISRLLEHRARQGSRCQISYKYSIDRHNIDDLEAAVKIAGELGVDSIQFKCIRNVPSELNLEDKQHLQRHLDELRKKYPSVRILGQLTPLKLRVPCWLSPVHVMIDPNGDLFLCCYYRHRMDRHRYGNVFRDGLSAAWYSPEHREKLREIEASSCESYDCRFIRYSELMATTMESGQFDFI